MGKLSIYWNKWYKCLGHVSKLLHHKKEQHGVYHYLDYYVLYSNIYLMNVPLKG